LPVRGPCGPRSSARHPGLLFGLVSALTKGAVEVLQDDGAGVLANWHLYALIVVGFAGMTITQLSLGPGSCRRRSPPARSSTRR
jgi:hypothetical protein